MTTVYVTKYLLSAGIQEFEINDHWTSRCNSGDIYVNYPRGLNGVLHLTKGEWHSTREDAVAARKVIAEKKIASLKRQISKLEKLANG